MPTPIVRSTVSLINPINISSISVVLKVYLLPPVAIESSVSCYLFFTGFRLSTYSDFLSSSLSSGSSFVAPLSSAVNVEIGSLVAFSKYTVYCYVSDTLSGSYNISDIRRTKLEFETSCCKTLSIVNSPSSIYADVTHYSESPSSTYQFLFSISAAPSINVVITPYVLDANSSAPINSLQVFPSSFQFSTYATTLTGNFFIAGNISSSRRVKVVFSFSGASSSEYSAGEIATFVLANSQPVQPPTLSSSSFGATGNSIFITFSGPTNLGNISDSVWICSRLFKFSGSNNTSCSWVNSSVVVSYLPMEQKFIAIGDLITVKSGLIRAACLIRGNCNSYVFLSSMSVIIQKPPNPVSPTVVLNVPTQSSLCSALVIDPSSSYGNGNAPWAYVAWSVFSSNEIAATVLNSFLSEYSIHNLSTKIYVPATKLYPANYTISLMLRNVFGKSGLATSEIIVSSNRNIPNVLITGSSGLTVYPSSALKLYSSVSTSACSTANVFKYKWSVFYNGKTLGVTTTDKDPSILSLPAYTFLANRMYSITLMVIALTTGSNATSPSVGYAATSIIIKSGPVIATVSGGYNRFVDISSTNQNVTLDASASTDTNFPANRQNNSSLKVEWSCSIASMANFGSNCTAILSYPFNVSRMTLIGSKMSAGMVYNVLVVVYTQDGRSDSKTVVVNAVANSIPQITINSNIVKFNPSSQFVLYSAIKFSSGVQAKWTASRSGKQVSFASLTSQNTTFSASQTSSNVVFPVVVTGGNFVPGSVVTFRITANAIGSSSRVSYSEITLQANSLPTGGVLIVSPSSGYALSTPFSYLSSQWIVDSGSLPISYSFFYAISNDRPLLSVSKLSTANSITTHLPSGLAVNEFSLTTSVFVYDYFLNSASINGSVIVKQNSSVQLSSYFAQTVASFGGSGNVDALLGSINTVSSTLNAVDCSNANASFCASLNRAKCSLVPNTCSSCLPGFVGVVGASNKPCKAIKLLNSSSSCGSCLYGNCVGGICVEDQKECPSGCSGNGNCSYIDPSGNTLTSCTITNVACTAKCVCSNGYGGLDCSLSHKALQEISNTRISMCAALVTVADTSSPSSALLDSTVSSLLSIYNPDEIISGSNSSACNAALAVCTSLVQQGYLAGASSSTISLFSQTLSSFLSTSGSVSPPKTGRRRTSTSDSTSLDTLVDTFSKGVLGTLVEGQNFNVTSDNLQISLRRDPVHKLLASGIEPSQTVAQSTYGAVPPRLNLANPAAANALDTGGGYSALVVTQYGTNPHPNSSSATTTIFRLSSNNLTALTATNSLEPPLYYITLQFSTVLNLTHFDPSKRRAENITLPICSLYDPFLAKYVPCSSCNISSYSTTNVTYACRSILPSQANLFGTPRFTYLLNNDARRSLAGSSNSEASEYTAILQKALQEIATVVQIKPFNPEEAKVALILVGSLFGLILFIGIYMARWDHFDHHRAIYVAKKNQESEGVKVDLDRFYSNDPTSEEFKSEQQTAEMNMPKWRRFLPAHLQLIRRMKPKKAKLVKPFKFGRRGDLITGNVSESNISLYIDQAINHEILSNDKPILSFLRALWKDHEYLNVFAEASLAASRLSRWLLLCSRFLSSLFVDSVFFLVFYTDNGTCAIYTDSTSCTTTINAATSSSYCTWTEDPSVANGGTCAMADPPSDIIYTLLISLVCVTVSFPLALFFDALFYMVAIYRPDLSRIGFTHPELWLGRSSNIKVNHNNDEMDLVDVNPTTKKNSVFQRREIDKIARFAYLDQLTPSEEADLLMEKVMYFLNTKIRSGKFLFSPSFLNDNERSTLAAIVKYCGVNPNGTPLQLPLRQLLFYGSTRKKLEAKLAEARVQQNEINRVLESKGELEVRNKDKALIQFFVKEHFNPFKQYILRFHYGVIFNDATAPLVHPLPWLLSWLAIILLLCFFLYWILAFAVSSGGATVQQWALIFVIVVAQDLTIVQVLRVFVIHVLAMFSVRPQLKYIHQVLKNCAIGLIQNAAVTYAAEEFSVMQFLSPACRAARMKVAENLFSSQLLRRIKDNDVRICRTNNDLSLAFAVLLLLSLPLVISLVSEIAGESVFTSFISVIVDAFVMGNDYLYNISIFALLAPYVGVVLLYLARYYLLGHAISRINRLLSKMYYKKSKYSMWRQSLRNRTRMNVLTVAQLMVSSLKRKILSVYKFFAKGRSRKNVFVTSDESALAWRNMNNSVDIHEMVTGSAAGRMAMLMETPLPDSAFSAGPFRGFKLTSTETSTTATATTTTATTLPRTRSKSRTRSTNEAALRASYATTVLNAYTLSSASAAVAERGSRGSAGTEEAPGRSAEATRRLQQEAGEYLFHSAGEGGHRDLTAIYSSFFSLPQLNKHMMHHSSFGGFHGSQSESTEDYADLDYVIDMTRGKAMLNDDIRERSKLFRAQARTPSHSRAQAKYVVPEGEEEELEHKGDEKQDLPPTPVARSGSVKGVRVRTSPSSAAAAKTGMESDRQRRLLQRPGGRPSVVKFQAPSIHDTNETDRSFHSSGEEEKEVQEEKKEES